MRLGRLDSPGSRVLLRIGPSIEADKGWSTKHGPHRRGVQTRRARPDGPPGTTTTLWTTALADDAVWVTRLRATAGATRADLLRVAR